MKRDELTEKQQVWLSHVKNVQTSGLSMTKYAEKNGVSLKALYNWKSQFKKQGILDSTRPTPKFVQVKAIDAAVPVETATTIIMPNGISIRTNHISCEMLSTLRRL